MKYEDEKYGFSLEVPDNWKRQRIFFQFLNTGRKIVYESPDRKADISVSVDRLREELNDRLTREVTMIRSLTNSSSLPRITSLKKVEDFALDGEENTVYLRYTTFDGRTAMNARMISSLHQGREYAIQSGYALNRYEETIDGIIQSFKFGNPQETSISSRKKFT